MDEKRLTHIDLFSGIGGFTIAAEWAGFRTVAFCEKDAFCQKILQKRFGGIIANSNSIESQEKSGDDEEVCKIQKTKCKSRYSSPISRGGDKSQGIPIIPEIRDFDGTKYRGATLLTGGFPCQPFSVAGKQKGKEDDRYLWPQMRRIISEAKPRWILAENVPGIFHMALDTVLSDLENKGYATGTFIIPACGLNAPHRRNRVWIIGYSTMRRCKRGGQKQVGERRKMADGAKGANSHAPDSDAGRIRRHESEGIKERSTTCSSYEQAPSNAKSRMPGKQTEQERREDFSRGDWEKAWHEVATRFCRVDDGVSDRIHRLKALGNAIVPQVAYEIMKNIAWIEKELFE